MEQDLEQIREGFPLGPRTPIRQASQQKQITPRTVRQVGRKPLFMSLYRLQSLHDICNKYKEIAQNYL